MTGFSFFTPPEKNCPMNRILMKGTLHEHNKKKKTKEKIQFLYLCIWNQTTALHLVGLFWQFLLKAVINITSKNLISLLPNQYQDSRWYLLCSFGACILSTYNINCYWGVKPRKYSRVSISAWRSATISDWTPSQKWFWRPYFLFKISFLSQHSNWNRNSLFCFSFK